MLDIAVRDALSAIAADGVPAPVNLWPAISRGVASRQPPALLRPTRRRLALIAAVAVVIVAGWTLVGSPESGQLSQVQAADVARNDPEVAAILRGDIAIVTVTQVVDQTALVAVQDSHGRQVTALVDLRSRIATSVYQGPQLSPALTAQALADVTADPRTAALLARGATIGRIVPVEVAFQRADPSPGQAAQGSETWAQVPLVVDGQTWTAMVDLPNARLDQVLDPQGQAVPLP